MNVIKILCIQKGKGFMIWFDNKFGSKTSRESFKDEEEAKESSKQLMKMMSQKEFVFEYSNGTPEVIRL